MFAAGKTLFSGCSLPRQQRHFLHDAVGVLRKNYPHGPTCDESRVTGDASNIWKWSSFNSGCWQVASTLNQRFALGFRCRRPDAVAGAHAVAHDAESVELEDLGDVDGVMLDLVERLVFGGRDRVRVLQLEEDERQAVNVDEDVWPAIVRAAYGQLVHCCRKRELLSLQWSQVRFSPRAEVFLPAGKTKVKRDRRIPLSTVVDILARRRLDPAGETLPPDAYVFGDEVGRRRHSIKTASGLTLKRAKITDLHFHDLRREAGSRWMDAGVSLAEFSDGSGTRTSRKRAHISGRPLATTMPRCAHTKSGSDAWVRRRQKNRRPRQPPEMNYGRRQSQSSATIY